MKEFDIDAFNELLLELKQACLAAASSYEELGLEDGRVLEADAALRDFLDIEE